jgi:hypothetical protein
MIMHRWDMYNRRHSPSHGTIEICARLSDGSIIYRWKSAATKEGAVARGGADKEEDTQE